MLRASWQGRSAGLSLPSPTHRVLTRQALQASLPWMRVCVIFSADRSHAPLDPLFVVAAWQPPGSTLRLLAVLKRHKYFGWSAGCSNQHPTTGRFSASAESPRCR